MLTKYPSVAKRKVGNVWRMRPSISRAFSAALFTVALAAFVPRSAYAIENDGSGGEPAVGDGKTLATTSEKLSPMNPFDVSYALSFTFDACGDATLGSEYRKAILAWIDECPFTPQAKDLFKQRAAHAEAKERDQLNAYVSEHGEFPAVVMEGKLSCNALLHYPEVESLKKALLLYSSGQLALAQALPATCEAGRSVEPK